jgi:hypothetical protein
LSLPKEFWQHQKNREDYLQWLAKELDIQKMEDWYNISPQQIQNLGGRVLLSKYRNSVSNLVETHFTKFLWIPWRFRFGRRKHLWYTRQNEEAYLEWLGKHLGFHEITDWYRIRKETFFENGGRSLISKYGTVFKLIQSVYPQHLWVESKFGVDVEKQSELLDKEAKELGIKAMEDSLDTRKLRTTSEDIPKSQKSSSECVQTANSEYPWKFQRVPRGFWDQKINQRNFLDWLGNQLAFKTVQDFYKLSYHDIERHGGAQILSKFGESPSKMVQNIYDHITWLPWKFRKVTNGFWNNEENVIQFVQWATNERGIQHWEGWYNISEYNIMEMGGATLLKKYGSLPNLMRFVYPQYPWDVSSFKAHGI